MYNYTITRFSCMGIFRLCFCAGVCLGGLGGIMLGLLDRGAVGILGGMFLGLIFGLVSGVCGVIYAAVFNALAPMTGGLPVHIAPIPAESKVPVSNENLTKEYLSGQN